MKKSGTRKSVFATLLLALAALAFVLAGAGCSSAKERIRIDYTEQVGCVYDSAEQTVTIEYGATFIIPEATVVDKNGNGLDYAVEYKLYDNEGTELRITSILLNLDRGEYSLTYSAHESKAKDLTLKLTVIDEAAPEVTITSLFVNAGSVGDAITLPAYRLKDISGVDQSATAERVTFNGVEVSLNGRSFVAESAGCYYYELSVRDNLGNAETKTIPITISERYVDSTVGDKQLMTFDDANYEKNVMKLYDSTENTSFGIVFSGIPDGENGIAPSGGAYRIAAPDNSKTSLLIRNNKTINSDGDSVGNIVFRIYTDELVEQIRILSPDGTREYAQFKYVMPGWSELTLNAHSAIGWYDDFEDFLLIMENEDAVVFYLDEIYYTEQWKDAERGENVLADFDEREYLELVANNHYSKTAKLEILTGEDKTALDGKAELTPEEERDKAALENADGGVLKVTANSSFDGFKVTFAEPVDVNEIVGIRVRIYFPEIYRSGSQCFATRVNFISNDGFIPSPAWGDYYYNAAGGYVAGWKDYWYTGATIKGSLSMAESSLVVGYYFAFVLDDATGCTFYVDEISVVLKSGEIGNDVPTAEGDEDGTFADFSLEKYAANVIPSTDKGVSYSFSGNPDYYGYATFSDGESAGLKVVHSNNVWNNGITNFFYYEGIEYVLPQTVTIRNSDNTPRAGEIVFRAYFEQADYVSVGVTNGAGTHCAYGNLAVPGRVFNATAGWNEFRINVKSLINEEIYDISSVYILSLTPGTWYLTDVRYTEYVPPYDDPDFMTETESGYYLLADFNEEEYLTSLSVSGYGSGSPDSVAIKNVTIGEEEYGVLEFKPSLSGENGFDLLFPHSITLASRKTVAANYIYFKVYAPVAPENARVNLATVNLGQYSTWGHYVTPKRVTYGLNAGWNIIRLDVKQLADEGVGDIEGLAFVANISWPAGTAESDKVLYIDSVYMDTEYDPANAVVLLDAPVIEATKEGTDLVFRWNAVENATSYAVRVNDGIEAEASACSYTVTDFNDDEDLRVTVIARREGSADASASWFYDRRFGTYDGDLNAIVLAKFDKTGYGGTFSQVGTALTERSITYSDFEGTSGGMRISTYGYDKMKLSGGFTYRFPFAVDNTKSRSITFRLSYVSGLENGWSIGHASETFFGLIDANGVMYNAVKYSSVDSSEANTIRNDGYYEKYNNPNPTFVIDLEGMRAENPQMGEIVALYFSHNKSVVFNLNYIVYDNGKTTLEAPALTLATGEEGYVVSWTEIANASGYVVKINGRIQSDVVGCSVVLTEPGTVTVKALGGELYNDSREVSLFVDTSFRAERGDGYYWLSNFDHPDAAMMFEGSTVSYNGGTCGAASYEYTSQMTGANLDIDTKGIAIKMPNAYGSVKFNLAEGFDLSTVNSLEFVLRQNANAARGINVALMLTRGDNVFVISGKMVNVGKAEGAGTMWSGMLGNPFSYALNCAHVGLNVQDYLSDIEATLGSTVIDGIIICVNTKPVNGDGTYDLVILDEIIYNKVSLSAPANLSCEKTEAGYLIRWDEVEKAESYDVLIDGEVASGYTGGTSFVSQTAGLITVTAKSSVVLDSAPSSLFFDPSFGAERGDGYYWLSNFDRSETADMFEKSTVSYSGGTCGKAYYEYVSQMTGTNLDIDTKGVLVMSPGAYGSAKYNLPQGFDLSSVNSLEFVIRQNLNAARGVNVGLLLTSGDNVFVISGKMVNVGKAEGAGTMWSSMLGNPFSFALNCIHVGLSVQDYLSDIEAAFGSTLIDGIIICVNTKAQNSDGTYDVVILDEIFYNKVTLSAPANLSCERTDEGFLISWDEVNKAESYEVLIDGEAAAGYTGGTSFVSQTAGLITVTAKSSVALDSAPSSLFFDPSFGAERGDGYYWLSNFDRSETADMFEKSTVSYSGGTCGTAYYEYVSQMTGSNLDIDTKGVLVMSPGAYGSAKYNLPQGFDLSSVNSLEFVIRQNLNAARGVNVGLLLTSGDKVYVISGKMVNVGKAEGAGTMWSSMLGNPFSFAYNCIHVGLNVQDYLSDIEAAFGSTVIDGIIICVNTKAQNSDGTYDVVIIDEIFYNKVSTPEEVESTTEE